MMVVHQGNRVLVLLVKVDHPALDLLEMVVLLVLDLLEMVVWDLQAHLVLQGKAFLDLMEFLELLEQVQEVELALAQHSVWHLVLETLLA